jgi:putative flippase GtrA
MNSGAGGVRVKFEQGPYVRLNYLVVKTNKDTNFSFVEFDYTCIFFWSNCLYLVIIKKISLFKSKNIESILKQNNIIKLIENEFTRFVLVGVIATAVHYGIYLLLIKFIPVNIAYSFGYVISFLMNFYLSSVFTFKSTPSLKKGLGFGISHLINYGLHILLLNFFLWIKLPKAYAPIPVFMIVIPVNFILVRTVFKSRKFQS